MYVLHIVTVTKKQIPQKYKLANTGIVCMYIKSYLFLLFLNLSRKLLYIIL